MRKRWQSAKLWVRQSLRLKVIAMAIIPVIIVQLTIGAVALIAYGRLTTNLVLNRDRELVRLTADQMAAQLTEDVEHLTRQGFTLNALLGVPTTRPDPTPPPENQPWDNGDIVILDAAGVVVAARSNRTDVIGQDWSTRSYVLAVAQSLEPVFSNLVPDGFYGEDVIVIAVPILNDADELWGMTLNILPPGETTSDEDLYKRMTQTLWHGDSTTIYLVDGAGRVIYHSDAQYIGQDMSADPMVQRVLAREEDAFRTKRIRKTIITAFAPIAGTEWGLIVEDDLAVSAHGMGGYQAALFLLLALGGVAPAVVVAVGLKRIVAPIEALTAAAQEVATGDFDQTIIVHTGDEVEALAIQFNQMSARLRESYAHLEQRVTERTAELAVAKEAAEKAQRTAESANRAKSVFLANMSHELRTPLNAILGYSQLMARDPRVTPTQQEHLATIGRSGEHLLGLINDVLTMSKIEAGRTTLQENAFDLHRQLEGLREMFAMRAADKKLALLLDVAPNVPRYIEADEGKLRQVLMNLLNNAVKFTEEGGVTLRVGKTRGGEGETRRGGDFPPSPPLPLPPSLLLTFEVEDTGAGIAVEEMASLFQPFVQTTTGQKSQEGTGLGLPISRQFVTLMGGELSVHSEVGQGSVFRFSIPVRLAEADEVAVNGAQPQRRVLGIEAEQHAPDGGPFRLLIVEDQAANRDVLVKLLTPFGFEVQCAVNGKEGIAYWEQWQPHLIWMDMRMPVMDGYEATRQIKAKAQAAGREVVVVALTASAFEEDRDAILGAGCDDFVRKPFRENDIFDVLTRHLGVRFTYEEEEADAVVSETPTAELSAAFHAQPDDWRSDFRQALIELDGNQMAALVAQIQASAPALADAMRQWLRDFEYEKIMQVSGNE